MTALPAGAIPPAQGGVRPGAALIARPSLVERLIESDAPLVVICAPAGYGKTTLVRQWAEEDERPFAWLKTSDDDNDPELLAEHLTRALFAAGVTRNRRLQPSLALARRGVGTTQTDLAAIVPVSGPVVIVLDEAEKLGDPLALAVLERLVDLLPAGSTLALASRLRPALGLGRLRAEDRVLEVGLHDLTLEARRSPPGRNSRFTLERQERRRPGRAGRRLARRAGPGRQVASRSTGRRAGGPAVQW